MRISYDKLWKMMKKNKLKKSELATAAEISGYTMAKLGKDEPVQMEVMMRLCKVFHCDIGDLMEIIEEAHEKGAAIIMITHYMDEVERLCDDILLLKDGVARASGPVKDVRKKFDNKSLDQIFVDIYGEEEDHE